MAPPLVPNCPPGFVPIKPDPLLETKAYAGYCIGESGDERNFLKTPGEAGEYDGLQLLACIGGDRVMVPGDPLTGPDIRQFAKITKWDPATRIYLDRSYSEPGHLCLNVPDTKTESGKTAVKGAITRLEDQCKMEGDKCGQLIEALEGTIPSHFWEIAAAVTGTDLLAAMTFEQWKALHVEFFKALNPVKLYRGAVSVFGHTSDWILARRVGELSLGGRWREWRAWRQAVRATRAEAATAGRLARMGQAVSESRPAQFLGRAWNRVPGPVKVAAGLAAVAYAVFGPSDAEAAEMPEDLKRGKDWIGSPVGERHAVPLPTVGDDILAFPDELL